MNNHSLQIQLVSFVDTLIGLSARCFVDKIKHDIDQLKIQLNVLDDEREIQEYGLYEPMYDFGPSENYKVQIDKIRQEQKQIIRDNNAVLWAAEWTVGDSKAKGRKMMGEYTRLIMRAFNGECDALLLKVKYNNIESIEKRIGTLYEAINKLGKTQSCTINPDYFTLKIQELHLY